MKGRKPTPTAILRLRGSRHAKNRAGEPRPAVEAPSCPRQLTREARKEWRRVAPQLVRMAVLTKADRAVLAAYCMAWSRWLKAEAELERTGGEVLKGLSGFPMPSPWLSVARKALEQMLKTGAELGLSPAARTRIKAETPHVHQEDGMEVLLRDGTRG